MYGADALSVVLWVMIIQEMMMHISCSRNLHVICVDVHFVAGISWGRTSLIISLPPKQQTYGSVKRPRPTIIAIMAHLRNIHGLP